jgi:hypothetical protein
MKIAKKASWARNKLPLLLIVLGLDACAQQDERMGAARHELAVAGSCIDPTDGIYGAIPDDSTDDRTAFQAAIDDAIAQGKQLCIPPGTFDIGFRARASGGSLDLANADHLTIAGSGHQTTIRFFGAGGGSSDDWFLFFVRNGAENVTLRDFRIDGNEGGISDVGEQTHAIHLGSCTASGTVSRVNIHNLDIFDVRGDAVRLCGAVNGGEVTDVDISHNRFLNNRRTGIAVQRATHRVTISNNFFQSTQDQDIDFEPSGAGGPSSFIITSNIIIRDEACLAVALSGQGLDEGSTMERSIFSHNVILNGGLMTYNLTRSIISNNFILGAPGTCEPVMFLRKLSEDLILSGNVAIRPSGASAQPVLQIIHHNSGLPRRITVQGDIYVQNTNAVIASVESASDVNIENTRFDFRGTSVDTHAGVNYRATVGSAVGLTVSSCEFNGDSNGGRLEAAVRVGKDHDVGQLAIVGNRGEGLKLGVQLLTSGSGSYLDYPVITANRWQTTSGDFNTLATPVIIGGNSGRPWLSADGAPSGACTNGSIYSRTGTGSGSVLHVCEGGAWVGK